jgi:hypothetical protein
MLMSKEMRMSKDMLKDLKSYLCFIFDILNTSLMT